MVGADTTVSGVEEDKSGLRYSGDKPIPCLYRPPDVLRGKVDVRVDLELSYILFFLYYQLLVT